MGHEEYAAVSDQVDDALSGSYHFMHWMQKYCQFAPVDPAKTLNKEARPATGRDLAGSYSYVIGQAQAILLHHLETEQAFFGKIKSNLLEPLVSHIAQIKAQKETVDKQMRPLITKIMNGRRKLASEKKTFLQLLDEYKLCLYDIDSNVGQQKKLPNVRKKLSDCVVKYERTVKEVFVFVVGWLVSVIEDIMHVVAQGNRRGIQRWHPSTLGDIALSGAGPLG